MTDRFNRTLLYLPADANTASIAPSTTSATAGAVGEMTHETASAVQSAAASGRPSRRGDRRARAVLVVRSTGASGWVRSTRPTRVAAGVVSPIRMLVNFPPRDPRRPGGGGPVEGAPPPRTGKRQRRTWASVIRRRRHPAEGGSREPAGRVKVRRRTTEGA